MRISKTYKNNLWAKALQSSSKNGSAMIFMIFVVGVLFMLGLFLIDYMTQEIVISLKK